MDVLSAPFVGFFLILVIWILAWSGLVLGLRISFMRFVEMTSRIGFFDFLSWQTAFGSAGHGTLVQMRLCFSDVILMRAWAAAAFVDPHALVSVFGVAVIIGMVICVCLGTTTLRHDHKGSRFAFEQAKATPRVDVAETPQASPCLEEQVLGFKRPGNEQSSASKCVCLFIRDLKGKSFQFQLDLGWDLEHTYLAVARRVGVPHGLFYMTWNGTMLTQNILLSLCVDDVLVMHGRIRGGGSDSDSGGGEWYCSRCRRWGCWVTKPTCFRCGLHRIDSDAAQNGSQPLPPRGSPPPPRGNSKGPSRAVSRERSYPGRSTQHSPPGPPTARNKGRGSPQANDPAVVQQLVDLLQTLGVSQQVVQDVQQAVNKSKPRVVEGKEHMLYVLKQKLDKANNHLAHVQEVLQKKEAEYLSALNRVEEQKALVTQLDKDYWEARRRLESSSDGGDETERQAVSVDEEDNDMSQDEDLLDNQFPEEWETVQPKKKGKKRRGGSTPPPPPLCKILCIFSLISKLLKQLMRGIWTV